MESYLKALNLSGISPNFWCSQEYFEKAGWRSHNCGLIYITDEDNEIMLPPITPEGKFHNFPVVTDVWSDLPGYNPKGQREFLDYEYLFSTLDFQTMAGGNWSIFRKNSRKWANRIGLEWEYKDVPRDYPTEKLDDLVVSWLGGLDDGESVCDSDVLLKYVRGGHNRRGLFTSDGELHALNIWDDNWRYINYRYCICKQEPFLSEFARLLFYQSIHREFGIKIVNDGGVLDRLSLKQFKDHMNPIAVRKVYTWKGMV